MTLAMTGCEIRRELDPIGKPLFSPLQPAEITRFILSKSDPENDDRWTVRLGHPAVPGPGENERDWEIQSDKLIDRRADTPFVLHLFDTLPSLKLKKPAPAGHLEDYGLSPPRFLLQWSVRSGAGEETWEIRFGTFQARDGLDFYAQFLGVAPNLAGKTFIAEGSTPRFLKLLTSLSILRQRTWSTLPADDVDEVELRHRGRGKSLFYSQRAGDEWLDRKGKAIRPAISAVSSWLEGFTQMQVREFIDDPTLTRIAQDKLDRTPLPEITLSDRKGRKTVFRVAKDQKHRLLGSVSSRPLAVFVLDEKKFRYPIPVDLHKKPRSGSSRQGKRIKMTQF